jgi:hypothetical protein
MARSITFSQADQALCLAVLKQIQVAGKSIDYELLRIELNLPSKGAASTRWSRFNTKLSGAGDSAVTFTAADQALCLAVLKQIKVAGKSIDYELLRIELNLPSRGAASTRWSRFNTKLKESAGETGETADTASSTPTGKAGKAKGRNSSAKKRKIDEEDQAGDQALETPTKVARRGKGTKSTKAVVKGEEDGDEVDGFVADNVQEEEKELDDFEDSGNGTGEEASEEASEKAVFSEDEA